MPAKPATEGPTFLGHPLGLAYLAFAEAWERFSYYGMQTLLGLYMAKQLLLAPHIGRVIGFGPFRAALEGAYGPLTTVALESAIFGLYGALVYMTPILGGLLADRVIGRTRAVTLGALLMAAGHFLMAFDQSFLIALALILTGVGCFKGNIATQVGDLYGPGDLRRADAFQAFMLGIQVAVIISPLVCSGLAAAFGWHWGFGAAGVGMLIGLLVYLSGRRYLPPEPAIRPLGAKGADAPARPKLAPGEGVTIAVLVALLPALALGAVGNQQMANAYLIWADKAVNLSFFGRTMPTGFLISFDSVISTVTMAGAILFWRWWATRRREPDEITKLTIGMVITAFGPVMLALGALFTPAGQKIGIAWPVAYHVINDIGFANVLPVALALYSRAAPKAIGGAMMGIFYLHLAVTSLLIGWLGGLLDKMPAFNFWMLHAGLIAVAAVMLIAARALAGHLLTPTVDPEAALAAA